MLSATCNSAGLKATCKVKSCAEMEGCCFLFSLHVMLTCTFKEKLLLKMVTKQKDILGQELWQTEKTRSSISNIVKL